MPDKVYHSPEQLIPRLGETLVNMGLLNADDLKKALQAQKESPEYQNRLLGEILIAMGMINQETLNSAITEQIFSLRAELVKANQQLEKRVQQRTLELENALNKLAELSQLKANFVSNLSHELRTPLTHIIGYLELINNEDLGPLSSNQKSAVQTMVRSSSQLEKLINDLIMFTGLENNDQKLFLQTVDLDSLFDAVILKSQSAAVNNHITMQKDLAQDAKFVFADQDKLQWVLLQLVENAIKFSPNGGLVTLLGNIQDKYVKITIRDQGIGIAQDQFERIFDEFYQIDGSSTRKFGGVGMGLSLVKKILLQHQTNIVVRSIENEGSEFSFLIQKPV